MQTSVKGIIFNTLVKIISEKKGPEGVSELEKRYGPLDFSPVKDYPVEDEIRLIKDTLMVGYGNTSDENYIAISKELFHYYSQNIFGKTFQSLFKTDPRNAAHMAGNLLKTVSSGVVVETKDLGPCKVSIRFKESLVNIKHFEGLIIAAAEFFNLDAKINGKIIGYCDYEFTVEW